MEENDLRLISFDVGVSCAVPNATEICGNRNYVSTCDGLSKEEALNSYTRDPHDSSRYIKCQQGHWLNNGQDGVAFNNMYHYNRRLFEKIECNSNSYQGLMMNLYLIHIENILQNFVKI